MTTGLPSQASPQPCPQAQSCRDDPAIQRGPTMTRTDHALAQPDIDAFYRLVAARRDVRNGFLPDPISDEVLTRVLTAAIQAPSVGLSQPWDFIILRDRALRERVHTLARRQRRTQVSAPCRTSGSRHAPRAWAWAG